MGEHTVCNKPDNKAAKLTAKFVDSRKHMLIAGRFLDN